LTTRKTRLYSGSRKSARATAAISEGSGRVLINKIPVELVTPYMARERILTPIELAGDYRDKVDLDVRVSGGGYMGQAEASAIAISRAFDKWFKTKDLRQRIVEFDKHLLSGDPRRKEAKKFGGPRARRKKQKSYR